MTQTLKNLINTVAAEVYELQDTKADRVELGAYVRTVAPDVVVVDSSGNTVPPLIRLVKTGNVLSINTENLRTVLGQITNGDITYVDLQNFINNVVTDNADPFQYLNITSDGQDLHVDYSGLLTLINSKAPGTSLSSYLRAVNNDAGDTAQTPLIQLTTPTVMDSSGNIIGKSLSINYAGLRDALNGKALAEEPQFFMNYYVKNVTLISKYSPQYPLNRLVELNHRKGSGVSSGPTTGIPAPGALLEVDIINLENTVEAKAPINNPTFTGTVSGITKEMIQLGNVNNTSDADKPISTATQAALTSLTNTVTAQGTALASKVDNSTLTDNYYTKTQVDASLTQKQTSLIVKGNDSNVQNSGQGFKLLDSSGNLRSLRATSPYNVELNNNTQLIITGPPSFTVFGDDATNGMRVVNASNVIKSLKAAGYIQIGHHLNEDGSENFNSLRIASTDALGIALDSKANRSELPSLTGYLNSVVNDANDLSNPKLIVLDTSGNALRINYATLRSVLSQKANASAIPDVSGFINTVSNYADSNTYITLSKTGQTLSVAYPNLVTTLNNLTTTVGQKQSALTAIGDSADVTSIRMLNGVNVRALRAGTNVTLTLASDIVTINGPNLSSYAPTSSPTFSGTITFDNASTLTGLTRVVTVGGNPVSQIIDQGLTDHIALLLGAKQNNLSATGDVVDTSSVRILNGANVRALKAGTNTTLSLANNIVTINGPDLSSYATTATVNTALTTKASSNQVAAQVALNGGGLVTWTGTHLKWSIRVLVLPVESTELGTDGHYNIHCPVSGTTITFYDGNTTITTVTVTTDGIPLGSYHSLWYEIPDPPAVLNSDNSRFRVVNYTNTTWSPTGNWMLLAIYSPESGLKWMPQQLTIPVNATKPSTYDAATGVCSWLTTSQVNGLQTALDAKQSALTARGDAADTSSIRILSGTNVRAIKAGTNVTLSLASDIVTINGPSSYAQYAGRFGYNSTTGALSYFQSHGRVTLSSSNIQRNSIGNYTFNLPQNVAHNAGCIATAQNGGSSFANGRFTTYTQFIITLWSDQQPYDGDVCFMTVP